LESPEQKRDGPPRLERKAHPVGLPSPAGAAPRGSSLAGSAGRGQTPSLRALARGVDRTRSRLPAMLPLSRRRREVGDPRKARHPTARTGLTIVVAPAGWKIASRTKPSPSSSRALYSVAGSSSREAPSKRCPPPTRPAPTQKTGPPTGASDRGGSRPGRPGPDRPIRRRLDIGKFKPLTLGDVRADAHT